MTHQNDPLAHAHHTAHDWMTTVAKRLGTEDRRYAYRVLRAWLHLVRDRLTVDSAAHLAAQLPEFLRGVYFEGWAPSKVPIRYDTTGFNNRFAREAGISTSNVQDAASAISVALSERFSPGQLDHVFALMPTGIRGEIEGEATSVPAPRRSVEHLRLTTLENNVLALTEAVRALARGLERLPGGGPAGSHLAKAAQEAHRILVTEGTVEVGR